MVTLRQVTVYTSETLTHALGAFRIAAIRQCKAAGGLEPLANAEVGWFHLQQSFSGFVLAGGVGDRA